MKTFDIIGPDEAIRPALVEKINNLTKPKGSLGMLESPATPSEYHLCCRSWYCRGRCQPLTQRNYLATNQ